MSTTRKRADTARLELLQGTLDLLILRTLARAPAHGHGIVKQIHQLSNEALLVEHGSLYPALHRLERRGLVASSWRQTEQLARPLKVYALTPEGRRQLTADTSRWDALVAAMAGVLRPA